LSGKYSRKDFVQRKMELKIHIVITKKRFEEEFVIDVFVPVKY
jgi:hypothetical protein